MKYPGIRTTWEFADMTELRLQELQEDLLLVVLDESPVHNCLDLSKMTLLRRSEPSEIHA